MNKKYTYYLLMLLSGLIGFGKIGVYAKFLTPAGLGAYSLCMLLSTYLMSLYGLGLYEGILGVFPTWYGQNLDEKAQVTRNEIIGFLIGSSIAICALSSLLAFSKIALPLQDSSLFAICLFSSISTFFLVFLADVRSRLRTLQFAIFMLLRAVLSITLGSIAAHVYGYVGILVSETIITLFLAILIATQEVENFSFKVPIFANLKPVFRVGFPLMLNGTVTSTAANIDKFFVVAALGTDIFGQYSLAMVIASGGAMVQSILYQQIGPEILHEIGRGLPPKQVLANLNQFIRRLLIISLLIAYPLLLIAYEVVSKYFSNYSQAVSTFPIIYVGALFTAMSLYENFTVVLGRTEYILVLNSFIILCVLLLSYIAVNNNSSIVVFSGIYAFGRSLYFFSTLIMAFWSVKKLTKTAL